MTKEKGKATLNRSRFKNKYLKWPSYENLLVFRCQKNRSNFLTKKGKEELLF